MGLEAVVSEILSRGSDEERKILQQAQQERQKALDAAEGEADALRARLLQETRTRVEALRREQLSASEFEARRRLLTAQRELTEDFRARLLEALTKLPKAERERIHAVLVKRAKKELDAGRIHCRKDDAAHLEKASGYGHGHEIQTAGGFQVESDDGTILLDYRFETLLEASWKDIQGELKGLFQG